MKMYSSIIIFILFAFIAMGCVGEENNEDIRKLSWEQIEDRAKKQKVYLNAWGGSYQINKYIQWTARRVLDKYDIMLIHVPIENPVEISQRIQREKLSRKKDGSVDLMWINGETFRVLKSQQLLEPDILSLIPARKKLVNNPIFYEDFTLPTDGDEVPWGTAQLTFFYNSKNTIQFTSYMDIINIAKKYKERLTYPQPPDFTGNAFLKGLFYSFTKPKDRKQLYSKYIGNATQKIFIESHFLWEFLDELHPYLWRKGKMFPPSISKLNNLYKDGEIFFGMNFNPYFAQSKVINKEFPKETKAFLPKEGSIANAHFLGIPYNSIAKEAALVVIHFLLSPEAQGKKSNISFWGDPTVLDKDKLTSKEQAYFQGENYGTTVAVPPKNIGIDVIKEFHASWETVITDMWKKKYFK